MGDRGIVFFNGKDQAWQAAAGDGEAVIIINEVTADQANQLYEKIQTYTPDPNTLTLAQLKQVIAFAQDELGLVDVGPAATPQAFENGGVIVVQNGEMRGVQPDILNEPTRSATAARLNPSPLI